MKNKELTPEEKLLNLIRQGKKKSELHQEASASNAGKTADEVSAKEVAKGSRSGGIQRGDIFSKIQILRAANKILIFFFILIFGIFIYNFVVRPARELPKVKPRMPKGKAEPLVQKVRPYAYYEDIGKEGFFETITYEAIKDIEKPDAKKLTKELELVGVIGGEKPVAIIKDKPKGKSYFLNKGEKLKDLTVEEIYEDKVILIYDDQQIELVL